MSFAPRRLSSSVHCPFGPGGDEGNRTLDPLLAGQVLSQLSYTPMFSHRSLETKQQLLKLFLSLYSRLFERISIRSRSP